MIQSSLPTDIAVRIEMAEQEMQRGYLDGLDPNKPAPNAKHSHSYIHGFLNGRSDKTGIPWADATRIRYRADLAIAADAGVPKHYQFFSEKSGRLQ